MNIRATVALHGGGLGHTAMSNWSVMMKLPSCLSKLAYQNLQKKLYEGSNLVFKQVAEKSAKAIKDAYGKMGDGLNKDGVLTIGVSFDGS